MVFKLPSFSPRRFFARLIGKLIYPTQYASKVAINPLYDFANTDKIAYDLQKFIIGCQQIFLIGLVQATHPQDVTIRLIR